MPSFRGGRILCFGANDIRAATLLHDNPHISIDMESLTGFGGNVHFSPGRYPGLTASRPSACIQW